MCDYCNNITILGQPRYIAKYRNSKKNGKNQESFPTGGRTPTPTPPPPPNPRVGCWEEEVRVVN